MVSDSLVSDKGVSTDYVEALQGTAPIWRGICRSMAADGVMPAVTESGAGIDPLAYERISTREMGYATLALATALFDPVVWAKQHEAERESKRRIYARSRQKQRAKREQQKQQKQEQAQKPKPKRRVVIMADVVFVPDEPKPKPKRKGNWRKPKCELPSRDEIMAAAESGLSLIEYTERLGITESQGRHLRRIAPGAKWKGKRRCKPRKANLPSADEVKEAADAGFTRIEAAELFGLKVQHAYYWFRRLAPNAAWLDGRAGRSA